MGLGLPMPPLVRFQLLGNILLWDSLILEDALRELAVDKLLSRYVVIGLSNACPGPGMAEKYRRVRLCGP